MALSKQNVRATCAKDNNSFQSRMHTLNRSFSKQITIIILARLQFSERFGAQIENSNLFVFSFLLLPFFYLSVFSLSCDFRWYRTPKLAFQPYSGQMAAIFSSYVFKSLARITCCSCHRKKFTLCVGWSLWCQGTKSIACYCSLDVILIHPD